VGWICILKIILIMKESVLQNIITVAKTLPPVWENRKERILGKDLLKENPDAVDGSGKPINKKIKYERPVRVQIDHLERLKKQYNQSGEKAIEQYIRWAHEMHRKQNPIPKKIQTA
jgi:hypothetical protein